MGKIKEVVDFKLPEVLNDNGVENLRLAIIRQATEDGIEGYSQVAPGEPMHDKNPDSRYSVEGFFKSDWFYFLSGGIDGEKALKEIQKQGQYRRWRRKHSCDRCPQKKCIHKSGEHYSTMDKGRLVCRIQREEDGFQAV